MNDLQHLAQQAVFLPSEESRNLYARLLAERLVVYLSLSRKIHRPKPRSRDRAIKRILNLLQQTTEVFPDSAAMCEIAHVSERTLQYAFRERYGIPPNVFIRYWRLNDARRLLLTAEPHYQTITEISNQCGFVIVSEFAKYYKRLHGELPSVTLGGVSQAND